MNLFFMQNIHKTALRLNYVNLFKKTPKIRPFIRHFKQNPNLTTFNEQNPIYATFRKPLAVEPLGGSFGIEK
jgi:hypothetical protein